MTSEKLLTMAKRLQLLLLLVPVDVVYRDQVICLHLTDVVSVDRQVKDGQVCVVFQVGYLSNEILLEIKLF